MSYDNHEWILPEKVFKNLTGDIYVDIDLDAAKFYSTKLNQRNTPIEFIREMQKVFALIDQQETENIRKAAKACSDSIAAGRAVLMSGAGNSAIPVQETFPRIGSIVGYPPSLGKETSKIF